MASVLKSWISRYGEEKALEMWKESCKKMSYSKTLPYYIEKYGEIDGVIKYKEKNSKLSVGENTLRKNGKTEEEILRIKNKHSASSAINLKHFINKYGENLGSEKYKEWISKTRERSHWCEEFYTSKGIETSVAKIIISRIQLRDRNYFTSKYGEKDGLIKWKNINSKKARTLDNFINKYGEEEGMAKFMAIKNNLFSKMEVELFEEIKKSGIEKEYFFGENQYKFGLRKEEWKEFNKKVFYVDFLDKEAKKIIEFNGDIWHGNPKIFNENDFPNPYKKNKKAFEIWEDDSKRYKFYNKLGYKVLIVWESDYIKNKESVLEECLKFLME